MPNWPIRKHQRHAGAWRRLSTPPCCAKARGFAKIAVAGNRRRTTGESALGELEAAAGFRLAVLLALDDTRVAGEESALFQRAAQVGLVVHQRLGNAVAHRASLTRQSAARYGANDVVLAVAVGSDQRLLDQHAQHRPREIDFNLARVDEDLTGAWLHPDAGDGIFALAGGVGAALRIELLHVFWRFRRR